MTALAVDHLVVAARTLDEGADWCEATLGIAPLAGGRHALMGTHNRVLLIATPAFPKAYLEIITVDPQAPPPGRSRWFDLDDPALAAALAAGPALVAWVARCEAIESACAALAALGVDPGRVLDAERDTPAGRLRWRIAVPDDGARRFGGALPTLIEWRGAHPADTMPACGVTLASFGVAGPEPLARALDALQAPLHARPGVPALAATLDTPRGAVTLRSPT